MGSKSIHQQFCVMHGDAFDCVLTTNFFTKEPEVLSLTLQPPNVLYVDHGCGREFVPLNYAAE